MLTQIGIQAFDCTFQEEKNQFVCYVSLLMDQLRYCPSLQQNLLIWMYISQDAIYLSRSIERAKLLNCLSHKMNCLKPYEVKLSHWVRISVALLRCAMILTFKYSQFCKWRHVSKRSIINLAQMVLIPNITISREILNKNHTWKYLLSSLSLIAICFTLGRSWPGTIHIIHYKQ